MDEDDFQTLEERIKRFDIEEFFNRPPSFNIDHGAVILITPNQVILALNDYNGRGGHDWNFERIVEEIYDEEISAYSLIRIKLINEVGNQSILVDFPIRQYSQKEFATFQKFYNEYNKKVQSLSEIIDPEGEGIITYRRADDWDAYSNNFDPILDRIKQLVDMDIKDYDYDEKILNYPKPTGKENKEILQSNFRTLVNHFKKLKRSLIIPRDLSGMESEILKIKQLIDQKEEFSIEERRDIIYEIVKEMNKVSRAIVANKEPKNKLLALVHLSRGVPKDEKWEKKIKDLLEKISSPGETQHRGIDDLCWALYDLKTIILEKKDNGESVDESDIDLFRKAEEELNYLRLRRGITWHVRRMIGKGKEVFFRSVFITNDFNNADLSQYPEITVRALETEIAKGNNSQDLSDDEDDYIRYLAFINKYREVYGENISSKFKRLLTASFEKMFGQSPYKTQLIEELNTKFKVPETDIGGH